MKKETAGLDGAQWPSRVAGGLACAEGWMVLHLGPIRGHVGSMVPGFHAGNSQIFYQWGQVSEISKKKKIGGGGCTPSAACQILVP